ncbi:hypothetical protein DL89DRAFT_265843 [Linderina pennispora]|uniref:Uncharacterized protein n=1 Tax=Linderina pennispora TaxID=61395 RepID=A0A1Y1WGH2_9FUNG|nr:uncharacterized protein DL89DRAFT_265843 [Linderina pennispora]ORX72234.1 hypothetical protein DL89DRAFT_265843 [Linderina pennispora]
MSKYTGKLGELYKAYSRAVSLWPADKLRPTHSYRDVLKRQMTNKFDKLISAIENLVSSKYRAENKLSEAITDPVSNKGYYTKLIASIDDAVKQNKKTALRVD